MRTGVLKITRKGQVTIPKMVRDKLKANTIYFDIEDDNIFVKEVRDAAGALHEYAAHAKSSSSMKEIKEKAWEEGVREKTRKKSS